MMEEKFPYRIFRVVANTPLAFETFGLTLVPEDGKPVFAFQAGQWVGVKLPHDAIPNRRNVAFSIASAPVESTHAIELAIKLYGSFSRMLQKLHVGDQVTIQGPFGRFVLQPEGDRAVFFAGGIGITPLRSMIRQILLSNDTREIFLFYSNRSPNSIAYEAEFRSLAAAKKAFHPIFLLTGDGIAGWDGETRRLDRAMFDQYVTDASRTEYYTCGPRPFMETVTEILASRGVDVAKNLHREFFG